VNIIFFLVHPAHYHLFKNVIKDLKSKKHKIRILIKSKDVLQELLDDEGWDYINTLNGEKKAKGKLSLGFEAIKGLIKREVHLARIVLGDRPDLMIGTEWSIAHIGRLFQIPSLIVNEDDTSATPENYFVYPFASDLILPAVCDVGKWKKKKIMYQGYHELAYLHPNYFVPDYKIVRSFNPEGERYFLLRLVKLSASHDIGKTGISNEITRKLIARLSQEGRVFINSERELATEFEKYRIRIKPSNMHHALYYSDLFIGDSQTMTAEAAVLGTPSIRFNDFVGKLGYLEELEHVYKLTFGVSPSQPESLYNKMDELLNMPDLKRVWRDRRQKMLSEKIDVTKMFVWLIENYPRSIDILKIDPDYQFIFN